MTSHTRLAIGMEPPATVINVSYRKLSGSQIFRNHESGALERAGENIFSVFDTYEDTLPCPPINGVQGRFADASARNIDTPPAKSMSISHVLNLKE